MDTINDPILDNAGQRDGSIVSDGVQRQRDALLYRLGQGTRNGISPAHEKRRALGKTREVIFAAWTWVKVSVVLSGILAIGGFAALQITDAEIVIKLPSTQQTCVFDETFDAARSKKNGK